MNQSINQLKGRDQELQVIKNKSINNIMKSLYPNPSIKSTTSCHLLHVPNYNNLLDCVNLKGPHNFSVFVFNHLS